MMIVKELMGDDHSSLYRGKQQNGQVISVHVVHLGIVLVGRSYQCSEPPGDWLFGFDPEKITRGVCSVLKNMQFWHRVQVNHNVLCKQHKWWSKFITVNEQQCNLFFYTKMSLKEIYFKQGFLYYLCTTLEENHISALTPPRMWFQCWFKRESTAFEMRWRAMCLRWRAMHYSNISWHYQKRWL